MLESLALVHWGTAWPFLLAIFVFSYLLGSIPFGLIFAWLSGAGDIRKIGSGNIGATNVLRTGKRWAAAATLLADAGKALVAVAMAEAWFGLDVFPAVAGFGAFTGHLYPVWLNFKGGKGVASFIGITIGLTLLVGLVTCLTWLVTARAFRTSSLAALVAAAMTPVYFALIGEYLFALLGVVLAVLIFYSHRSNLQRLRRGEEPKIGRK
ncbi:MAG: glycerol-3-phosphate 1-O-acyltransferase PlsY [Alphaproteobacteria bacterium]|nr:glycerol-3-phosphate 1-O-acyltransferase PlsY [Alphaproteobacteria bacterium]